jgi:hypothetical protein
MRAVEICRTPDRDVRSSVDLNQGFAGIFDFSSLLLGRTPI